MTDNWNNKYHYGIPDNDWEEIKKRDGDCIYCHKKMLEPKDSKDRRNWRTVEHLNYVKGWDSVKSFVEVGKSTTHIVGVCCWSCNSSRKDKSISDWFDSKYCIDHKISINSVSNVVKNFLKNKDEYEKIFKNCLVDNKAV